MGFANFDILAILYVIANLLSSLSYIPQTAALLKDKTNSKSVSISSWGMWLMSSSIALTYAIIRIQDLPVILAGGVSFIGCVIVFTLLLFNRFIKAEGISIVEILARTTGEITKPKTYP